MAFLDVVFFSLFGAYVVQEVFGIKVIDPEKYPFLWYWVNALADHPVVKEASPPLEKLAGRLNFIRQDAFKSSAS